MIESKVPADRIRRVYDVTSRCYRLSASMFDRRARRLGLRHAQVKPGESVLDVGCGPCISLREIAGRAGDGSLIVGVDCSFRMLEAGRRTLRAGGAAPRLVQADGRWMPFRHGSFDVVLSAYLLDLLSLRDMQAALDEFHRILRPGGRLVLVSMTGRSESKTSLWERLYALSPSWAAAWLLGGCRPVHLAGPAARAGFRDVRRELVRQFIPSEIVTASRPAGR